MRLKRQDISGREPAVGLGGSGRAPVLGGVAGAIKQLQSGDVLIRQAAVERLFQYRERAVTPLGRLLVERHEDPDVQIAAIQVLEQIGTARARKAIGIAIRSPRYSVSLTAQEVFGRMGSKPTGVRALLARLSRRAAPPSWQDLELMLLRVLDQPETGDRTGLLGLLLEFLRLGQAGSDRLLELVAVSPEALRAVHGIALVALETKGMHRAVALRLLARFLNHPDRTLVKLAARSLAAAGDRAVDLLAEALLRGDAEARAQVAAAMGAVRHEKVVPALAQALRDEDPKVCEAAALALEAHGRSVPRELQAAVAVYRKRWDRLERLGAAAAPALLQALDSEAETDRVAIIRRLGLIGDRQSIPALRELLRDPGKYVREAAATALGDIGHPSTIAALQGATRDADQWVRYAAEQALTKFKIQNSKFKIENEQPVASLPLHRHERTQHPGFEF